MLIFLSCDLILERGRLPFKLKVVIRSNQLTCHSENFKSFNLILLVLVFYIQNALVQSADLRKLMLRFIDEKVSYFGCKDLFHVKREVCRNFI